MTHGLMASATSVNRRLKELLLSACVGTPGDWEVLVTGHSLGGALATLIAPELAAGVDSSRGFKPREDTGWWSTLLKKPSFCTTFSKASSVIASSKCDSSNCVSKVRNVPCRQTSKIEIL